MAKQIIGVAFKNALAKNIPKNHILYSVINVHTVKLSYSTTPNMSSKMGAHNNRVESKNQKKGK